MFIQKLKKIYEDAISGQAQQRAVVCTPFAYFSQFNQEAQKVILSELFAEKKLNKSLIKYLVNSIQDIKVLDFIYFLLVSDNDKPKEVEFYKELLQIIKRKLDFLNKYISQKEKELKFEADVIKKAEVIIEAIKYDPDSGNDPFERALFDFKKLQMKDKIEILDYLFLEFAPLSRQNLNNSLAFLDEYTNVNDVSALKDEEVEEAIKIVFSLLNSFDKQYPKAKEFVSYSFSEHFIETRILHCLLKNYLGFFFVKKLTKLLKVAGPENSNIGQAFDLIRDIKFKLSVFRFIDSEKKGHEKSITLEYFRYLISAASIVDEELDISNENTLIYFNNVYDLLKKSVDLIKGEFYELNYLANQRVQETAINSWLYGLEIWFDKYIYALEKRNFIAKEGQAHLLIEKLKKDFDKEIVEKFCSK